MKPKHEELFYYLLWTADAFLRPGWRDVDQSFETWALHRGLSRRLAELARQELIQRHPDPNLERIVRLTEKGRELALGGRDPQVQWSRPWDGRWRFVLFDVPMGRDDLRQNLLRLLRRRHFGFLQKSVWVSPDPATDVRKVLGQSRIQADAFLIVEGTPAAGESDSDVVGAAWDFEAINRHYEHYLSFVQKPPALRSRLPEWARRENDLWKEALRHDPLLPQALLPASYLGREAIKRRAKIFAHLLASHPERASEH